jgi:hypothetical protein
LNGNKYNSNICDSIEHEFDEWYDNAMLIWREKKNIDEFKKKSVKDYFDDLFKDFIKNDTNEIQELKKAILKSYQSYLCIYISCNNISDCSLSELGSFVLFPGNDEEFPGGYSTLINYLSSKLPKDSIKLNHPVEKVIIEDDDNNVKIECKNNSIFYSKHLIVTCSLNYLKENYKTLFNSDKVLFNEKKVEAMNEIKMGIVDNFLLIYENDIEFIPKDIDSVTPVLTGDDNLGISRKWYQNLYRIFKFYDNILRFFIYGEEAIYLETLSDDEIIKTITKVLKRLLNNECIPEPKMIIRYLNKMISNFKRFLLLYIRSKWYENQYIRGSYSYIPVNGTSDSIKIFSEPFYLDGSVSKIFYQVN